MKLRKKRQRCEIYRDFLHMFADTFVKNPEYTAYWIENDNPGVQAED